MKKIRVALVDDHALFRSGLRLLLKNVHDLEVVGEATSGEEALALATAQKPDILLLDLTLPDASGIATLGRILQQSPQTKVLVVTMHDDAALVRAALAAGAKGYLVKTAMDTELVTAIHAVARGRTFVNLDLTPDQLGVLLENSRTDETDAAVGPLSTLSNREREVFQFVARGFTNQDIADRLDISVKTIETYRARIGEKLGLKSRADFIRFAVDAGILTPGTGQQ